MRSTDVAGGGAPSPCPAHERVGEAGIEGLTVWVPWLHLEGFPMMGFWWWCAQGTDSGVSSPCSPGPLLGSCIGIRALPQFQLVLPASVAGASDLLLTWLNYMSASSSQQIWEGLERHPYWQTEKRNIMGCNEMKGTLENTVQGAHGVMGADSCPVYHLEHLTCREPNFNPKGLAQGSTAH